MLSRSPSGFSDGRDVTDIDQLLKPREGADSAVEEREEDVGEAAEDLCSQIGCGSNNVCWLYQGADCIDCIWVSGLSGYCSSTQ